MPGKMEMKDRQLMVLVFVLLGGFFLLVFFVPLGLRSGGSSESCNSSSAPKLLQSRSAGIKRALERNFKPQQVPQVCSLRGEGMKTSTYPSSPQLFEKFED